MNEAILPELDAALSAIEFPSGFLDDYEQLECLAYGHGTETFLVRKKGESKMYIAKCYDLGVFNAVRESDILRSLSNDGLPAFADEYRSEDFACIVREYIEGTPLDKYMAGRPLTPSRAISICVQLCDILTCLHTQTPPVIHRDIKPQNVVIKPTGEAALIDFDIARTYANDSETDTQFIGTRTYAPPEQYGFSQTDCRADVYSLGVLLNYMLTGHTDVKHAHIADKRLAAIVRRCAAFAPEQRYSSALAVKRALLRANGSKRRRYALACALALCLLTAGFALGRYTSFLSPAAVIESVQFTEPLIEKAVRAQLHKAEGEHITQDELLSVRNLYIFGTEVSDTQNAFMDGLNGWTLPRGDIVSFADVEMLPNLEVLYVNYQPLADIAPVSSLKNLRYLDVRHTYVADISPLSNMPALDSVVLFDTNVTDLSPLSSCVRLTDLEIGLTLIDSIEDIPSLPNLTRLSLRQCSLRDLSGIERFRKLEGLWIAGTGIKDLAPLEELPRLNLLILDESMREAARALDNASLTIQYE